MSVFDLSNIRKTFQNGQVKEEVLKGINLSLKQGEITALIGTSGSGKSTLLTIAAGLQETSDGSVLFEGNNLVTMSKEQVRKIRSEKFGFVFQFAHLVPFLTVEEQLLLMLDIATSPLSKRERKREVDRILELIGMTHRKKALPASLSGGEKQRVAIGRAIIHQPMLLFADEPTASLDSERSKDIMLLLKDLSKQLQITTLMVTHDEDMLPYVDKVVKMTDGKITLTD